MKIERLMRLHRLQEEADNGKEGSAGLTEADKEMARKAAEKELADKAAADKAAEEGKGDGDDLAAQLAKEKAEKAELLKETMQRKDSLKEANAKIEADRAELERLRAIETAQKTEEENAKLEKLRADKDHAAVEQHLIDQHKNELATQKEQLETASAAEIKRLTEENEALRVQNEQVATEALFSDVSPELNKHYVMPKASAKAILGGYVAVENGVAKIFNKPAGVEGRVEMVDGSGIPMPPKTAFSMIMEKHPDHDELARSKILAGAGSSSDGSSSKETTKTTELYGQDRILAGLEKSSARK